MSFLRDFGAGLFTGIGNQMQQREEEERRLQIEEALMKRRLAWQTQMENKINPRQPEAYGVPVQRGPGYWAQPTQQYVPPEFDPETYDIVKPASYVPGPDMPAQDPTALTPKDAARLELDQDRLDAYRDRTEAQRNRPVRTGGAEDDGSKPPKSRTKLLPDNMQVQQEWDSEAKEWVDVSEPVPRWSGGRQPGKEPEKTGVERLTPGQRVSYLEKVNKGREGDLRTIADGLGLDLSRFDRSFGEGQEAARTEAIRAALQSAIKPAGKQAEKPTSGIQAPPDAKPGDRVRQKSTGKIFVVQDDGTMVEA